MNLTNRQNINNFFLIIISIPVYFFFDFLTSIFYLTLIILPKLISNNSFLNTISDKDHGINNINHYRLGGIIILIYFFIGFFLLDFNYEFFNRNYTNLFIFVLLSVSIIGFLDDLFGGLNYRIKFLFLFISIAILLYFDRQFIFNSTSIVFINNLLQFEIVSLFLSLIIIVGFVNASNISDGANGILSGISSIVFLILFLETNDIIFYDLFKFLLVFFFLNIVISNVYLGDTGSYLFGFLISAICLYYYNNQTISAGFLAALLSYPCLEISYSIMRRLIKKHNPLKPDNKHLHNLIFNYLNKSEIKKINNSLTGLIILFLFSFPVLLFYLLNYDNFSIVYWYIFVLQTICYFTIYGFLNKKLDEL